MTAASFRQLPSRSRSVFLRPMPTTAWFPTLIYDEPLQRSGAWRYNQKLLAECHSLRDYDDVGRKWSARHYPGGYTSYASLNQLHRMSSSFADLERKLLVHVKRFARELDFDLARRTVAITDLWVNILPQAALHSLHLHPLSFVSGTYYVVTPRGCPGIKFEDPRLDRFMAAPPRRTNPKPSGRIHVTYPARAGHVILFESWLRHEVVANETDAERISISFNCNWS